MPLGSEVSRPIDKEAGMRRAFRYTLLVISLWSFAFTASSVLNAWVDKILPSTASQDVSALISQLLSQLLFQPWSFLIRDIVGYQIAAILVGFSVFVWLFLTIGREEVHGPAGRDARGWKILTYLMLISIFSFLTGQLSGLIGGFLNGDEVLKPLLHFVVYLLVAGSIFLYYLFDLKMSQTNIRRWTFLGWLTLLAIVALGYGLYTIGSPFAARAAKLDAARLADFAKISTAIQRYAEQNNALPKTLEDVMSDSSNSIIYSSPNTKDPSTGKPYEYVTTSDTAYKLCTNFSADSSSDDSVSKKKANASDTSDPLQRLLQIGSATANATSTVHQKGHDCITYSVSLPLNAMSNPSPTTMTSQSSNIPSSLQSKMHDITAKLPAYIQKNASQSSTIGQLMGTMGQDMQSQKYAEAEQTADRILKMINSSASAHTGQR